MFLVRSLWNPIVSLFACCVLTTTSMAQTVEPTPQIKQIEPTPAMISPEICFKQSDPKWSAYVSFNWTTESYFLADRVDQNQRFSYTDKRITTGVTYQINPHWQIEGTAGYAFDRSYFQGMNTFTDNDFDCIDIGDGPFLALKLQRRF